jgi:hypothetical protein
MEEKDQDFEAYGNRPSPILEMRDIQSNVPSISSAGPELRARQRWPMQVQRTTQHGPTAVVSTMTTSSWHYKIRAACHWLVCHLSLVVKTNDRTTPGPQAEVSYLRPRVRPSEEPVPFEHWVLIQVWSNLLFSPPLLFRWYPSIRCMHPNQIYHNDLSKVISSLSCAASATESLSTEAVDNGPRTVGPP